MSWFTTNSARLTDEFIEISQAHGDAEACFQLSRLVGDLSNLLTDNLDRVVHAEKEDE